MAAGKGGKTDPAKTSQSDKKKDSVSRLIYKMSQSKSIIKTRTRMRVSTSACVALTHAITYLLVELIDGGHNSAVSEQKKKVMPKHINATIAMDNEFNHIFQGIVIKDGGCTGYLRNEDIKVKVKKA
ncbi:hypothetical protein GVAV_000469 [Gurleya vavrai]